MNMEYPFEAVANSRLGTPRWAGTNPVSNAQALAWIEKGRRCAEPLLNFAGRVADPADVVPQVADSTDDRLYGNFMLAWLDSAETPRVVRYLPDASFFLQLLRLSYQPVFQYRPELSHLLNGMSRPEMSLTNDVLQIQLRGLEKEYSMVRHHALMLFYAALWLEEPERSLWMELYDELTSYVFERPGGPPNLEQLSLAEAGAFEDFVALAARTLTTDDADLLLDTPAELTRILDYQLYAAAAVGLLWRTYKDVAAPRRDAWHREQLSDQYLRADYLEQSWV